MLSLSLSFAFFLEQFPILYAEGKKQSKKERERMRERV